MEAQKQRVEFTASELSLFCYQFSVVLKSGIPYLEGIHLLNEEIVEPKFKKAATQITEAVDHGKGLEEAMREADAFPSYMLEMIGIAEKTGRLAEVFEKLSAYYAQNDQVRAKVRSALTYPLILVALMTAVILLLILKILPVFHEILLSVGGDVPGATQAILNVSLWLKGASWGVLGVAVVLLAGILWVVKAKAAQGMRDAFFVSFPVVKRIYRQSVTVRIARALSLLVHSGMDLQLSLERVIPLIGNRQIEAVMKVAAEKLEVGADIESALSETGIFPSLFLKMVRVGQKSGELDETLEKVSDIYEGELDRSLHNLTASIEPTLVIILSLIVGAIMLLVMLPLIDIMSSIG
jgi:type IV pilus assembly protein PilC